MLTLLSPAKKLLAFSEPFENNTTDPIFLHETDQLVHIMKMKSVEEIASLMDLSNDLAKLNYDRYQKFKSHNTGFESTYPAIYLFQGDVYQGLQASSWNDKDLAYAQNHLGILSGLYGFLRPMDRIQPYRLEMGIPLINPKGKNLYAFWKEQILKTLNHLLEKQERPGLINLASTEYFKVIDSKKLKFPIITVNFYEKKGSEVKMISFLAKKARGMMARYLMQNQIDDVESIKNFDESGYSFNPEMSTSNTLCFVCPRT